MSSHRIHMLVLGALSVSMFAVGCGDRGPKLVNAVGNVTYQGDPLPNATIVFVPDGDELTAFATTNDEGQFTITTQGRPGALPGSYRVAITAIRLLKEVSEQEAISMTNEQLYANQESVIPVKYNNGISSGLSANVSQDPKQNQFAFDLQ